MRNVINFIGFQIGWFACVLGAANDQTQLALLIIMIILALHLYKNNSPAELYTILSAIIIGFIWESCLVTSELLSYGSASVPLFFAPLWLVAIWALFATTINYSMAWLKKYLFFASLLGAIFGPLAFIAGERLDAVQFVDRPLALLALALGWACLMPFLLWLGDFFKCRFESLEA